MKNRSSGDWVGVADRFYWVDPSVAGIDGVARVCEAVLGRIRARITAAHIDGISDLDELPVDAAHALADLERVAEEAHRERIASSRWYRWSRGANPPTFMGIDLRPDRDEDIEILAKFGPYTIHAEVFIDGERGSCLTMHDTGTSVTFRWKEDEIVELAKDAAVPQTALVLLPEAR